ncbi:MAG: DUF1801 domain-containing protein [Acidobacteria bacterium]|nr:DUF1801 domain-containing protein [Acidobacteriota bacterium]
MKKSASPATIDEYLANVPEPHRSTLNKLRDIIRELAPPGTTEAISYGMPTFKYKGGLIAFGAFTKHCSLFPMSGRVIEKFQTELSRYKTSKGTIQFPVDQPPPKALIRKILKERVAQNEERKR